MTQPDPTDATRFEEMYRDERTRHGLPAATPWDIGGPQPVVQQLVALGAIKGEVLDPGTGPGHHAIYYASKGYSATGIDGSEGALQRARDNAKKAGVSVNFQLADATKLEGLDGRFDTVVDCAFYHVFSDVPEAKRLYARALHRATKPGARLYMFEFAHYAVNGIIAPLSAIFAPFGFAEHLGCTLGARPQTRKMLGKLASLWGVPIRVGIQTQPIGSVMDIRGPAFTAFPKGLDLKSWSKQFQTLDLPGVSR